MAKLFLRNGVTSVILRVKIMDSTSTVGAGKTGLLSSSSGLIISTIADVEATPTVYTVAASNIETITTLGTFAAPTASKCRFKEVSATNHPGLYEIQIANARWAVSGALSLIVSVHGASGAAQVDAEIQLGFAASSITEAAHDPASLDDTALIAAIAAAIWNSVRASYTTAGTMGQGPSKVISGIATGTPTTTTMAASALPSTSNDQYNSPNPRSILWTSGVLDGTRAVILDYVNSTRTLTFAAVHTAPSAGDAFIIL